MSKKITVEFKCETAKLVLDQNYTYLEAAKAMNVSLSAISRWVRALRLERQGKTAPGLPLTPEQIELSAMKTRVSQSPKKKYKFKNKKIRVFIFCPVIHALKISIKHSYK